MLLAEQQVVTSWHQGREPLALAEIVAVQNSVAIWRREQNPVISDYYQTAYTALGMGIRSVLSVSSLTANLQQMLPDEAGKQQAIEDIFLLADMLTCLFNCQEVGMRLVPLQKAMCPRFHVDHIPVRLVTTYLGDGTQWVPNNTVASVALRTKLQALNNANVSRIHATESVQQLRSFDVALLKGSAWQGEPPSRHSPLLSGRSQHTTRFALP